MRLAPEPMMSDRRPGYATAAVEAAGHDEPPVTIIEPRSGWQILDLGELWRARELLYLLAWRDIQVRYKQTALGAAWAVLQPLATMVVFTLFFGRLATTPTLPVPYPLFVLSGLLPWGFLAAAVGSAAQSVVGSQSLITKVYFPRLLIPLGTVAAALVDFAVAYGLLLALMLYYGVAPGWGIALLPVILLGLMATALGIGTLLSALTVAYRDFRHVVPFALQLWMFATPAIYMQADRVVGPRWIALLPLNPAYGLIVNFRGAMLGEAPDWYALLVSLAVGAVFLLVGCAYFRRVERSFADVV